MIRAIAPDTYAVLCDGCGQASAGAEAVAADALRMAALLGWRRDGMRDLCRGCTGPKPLTPLFRLGRVFATADVSRRVTTAQIAKLLERHGQGDFGDVCDEDRQANVEAMHDGVRIISSYLVVLVGAAESAEAVKVWVITEADRSATTVLFPGEY